MATIGGLLMPDLYDSFQQGQKDGEAQLQQRTLRRYAQPALNGDQGALAKIYGVDPDAGMKVQQQAGAMRDGAQKKLGEFTRTVAQLAQSGDMDAAANYYAANIGALQAATGMHLGSQLDPSMVPHIANIANALNPQSKSDLINVGAGGSVFDPVTRKAVYTNPGVEKPPQIVTVSRPDNTTQQFQNTPQGLVPLQLAPQGQAPQAGEQDPMPAILQRANALAASGVPDDQVRQYIQQQAQAAGVQMSPPQADAQPDPSGGMGIPSAAPAAGQLGVSGPKGSMSLIQQRQQQIQDLAASGVQLTPAQKQNYLTTGKPGEDSGATDKDPLAGLSPSDAALVKGIAEYRVLPSSLGRSSNRAELLARASMLNPDYNEAGAKGAYTYINDLSKSGTTSAGGAVQSINTGLNHLGTLMRANSELPGTNFPLVNKAENALSTATGKTAATNWQQATYLFSQEMAKLVKGGVANEGEVRDIIGQLDASKSPTQRAQAIQQAAEFMYGRIQAVEDRGDRVLGSMAPNVSLMTKEAQQNLRAAYKLGGRDLPSLRPPGDLKSYLRQIHSGGAPQPETTDEQGKPAGAPSDADPLGILK